MNKDKLKDWCLETFKDGKVKVTSGSEEVIPKTNIKKINPTIYKIKSITILYYDGNYFKNKNYYIPKLKQ
ncbi:MAG: hypothetical protein ACK5HP_00445 [Bacilli bacterium]